MENKNKKLLRYTHITAREIKKQYPESELGTVLENP
jgi:hypothetical protein